MTTIKTYSELISIPRFIDRYRYLKIGGRVGEETFGFDRYLNQLFYRSKEWRQFRDSVIVRDLGHDLAMTGEEFMIRGKILIHHLNPITLRDINERSPSLLDFENVVAVSHNTHNAIHYGDETLLDLGKVIERFPHDTCPWK